MEKVDSKCKRTSA